MSGSTVPPPYFYEVSSPEHASGSLYSHIPDSFKGRVQTFPCCFKRAADLRREIGDVTEANDIAKQQSTLQVIQKDRACKDWYTYSEDFNLKEHAEEQMRQDLARELENSRLRSQSFERKITVTLWVIVAFFAMVQILVGFLSLAYPDGWPWLVEWFQPSKDLPRVPNPILPRF